MAKTARKAMAVVAAAAALFTAHSAIADERHQTRIALQVTDYWQLPAAVLVSAEADVAAIYDRIGVDVVWTASDGSANAARNFTVVILSPEIGLKMIATDGVGPNVMGSALRAARRAYIFAHRVQAVSASQLIDFQKFLGKVIAHEIGHLLLMDHSQFGIMRPGIQVRTNESDWFTLTQGVRIRAELAGPAR